MPTKNAFVLIHFGNNIKYLELELYFCKMLKQKTTQDIIYMYSVNDTPKCFVDEIRKCVTDCIGYDDKAITYNVSFESHYSSFNTLRTCNFIFAYTLKQYEKICIIESDMVVMGQLDSVFGLHSPSILYYDSGNADLNKHNSYRVTPESVLRTCKDSSKVNGGVLVIRPSITMFEAYKKAIPIIAKEGCKYPNEALFEYINPTFYNLPVRYNLSHYHTLRLPSYGMTEKDVLVFHFNETDYKHLDIIKDNWLPNMEHNEKYKIKKIPVHYFNDTVYKVYSNEVNDALKACTNAPLPAPAAVSAAAASVIPPPPPIPALITESEPKWIVQKSTKHNRDYWFNTITGQSVWEEPEEIKKRRIGGRTKRRYYRKRRNQRKTLQRRSRRHPRKQ